MLGVGLSAVFSQNYLVQTFKKGLDYIDPIWLSLASGNPCYNLDFYTSSNAEIKQIFHTHSQHRDISIVEGNKGLYDGMTTAGGDSNADMAKLLGLPIILVLDCSGITRGIAPLLLGYQRFEDVNIVGVILNKIAGNRHQQKLIKAVQNYTDLTIFGVIGRDEKLFVKERYLGLIPANEDSKCSSHLQQLKQLINNEVDTENILKKTFNKQKTLTKNLYGQEWLKSPKTNKVLAVAKDKAFGFYYADDLAKFERLGVKIVYFNTFVDDKLPSADALFIGGGFPEIYVAEIANNTALLADIKQKINQGLPTYAECGGLMYLTQGIYSKGDFFHTVGAINAKTKVHKKPVGRGYAQLSPNKNHPWQLKSKIIYAHEFHYSELSDVADNLQYAYSVNRGVGIKDGKDGIILNNLLACYTHSYSTDANNWVAQFVNFFTDIDF